MSIPSENDIASRLPMVRRYEAAGFRAWPAATVHYDGSWLIRLTAGHPARRLNSINILDRGDVRNIAERLGKAQRRFDAYGRKMTMRVTPLTGKEVNKFLDEEGWASRSESIVMQLPLNTITSHDFLDHIPLRDVGRFVDALIQVRQAEQSFKPGLSEIISSIVANAGLFMMEHEGKPAATAVCVHDHELAGLFEVATRAEHQRKGLGREISTAALRWAKLLGARHAWLQVEADNVPALKLYASLGFSEVYRYHYRQPD